VGEYRTERVGQLIQEKIGALIVEGKIKDPRVNPFLSVSGVKVSRDFSWADVYISTFKTESLSGDQKDKPSQKLSSLAKGVLGMQSAAGFIQAQLAKEMRLRQTPKLRFHEDQSIREGFDMIKKIDDLAAHGTSG